MWSNFPLLMNLALLECGVESFGESRKDQFSRQNVTFGRQWKICCYQTLSPFSPPISQFSIWKMFAICTNQVWNLGMPNIHVYIFWAFHRWKYLTVRFWLKFALSLVPTFVVGVCLWNLWKWKCNYFNLSSVSARPPERKHVPIERHPGARRLAACLLQTKPQLSPPMLSLSLSKWPHF